MLGSASSINPDHNPRIVNEVVDIDRYPTSRIPVNQGEEVTLGDLHGNALKLLFTLIKHDLIKGVDAQEYGKFKDLYYKNVNNITKEDLLDFKRMINKIEIKDRRLLRLVGDEIADRGSNDYFTLKILERMHNLGNPVEVIYSNHGEECFYVKKNQRGISEEQAVSIHNMNELLNKWDEELHLKGEVNALMDNVYFPSLRLVGYTLSNDKKSIVLHSHAPVALSQNISARMLDAKHYNNGALSIQSMAQLLGVTFNDDSAESLAATIDNINTKFTEIVTKDEDYWAKHDEFSRFCWNRDHDIDRPRNHNGFEIHYAHGHDSRRPSTPHPHVHIPAANRI